MNKEQYKEVSVYTYLAKSVGMIQLCVDISRESADSFVIKKYGPFAQQFEGLGNITVEKIVDMADDVLQKRQSEVIEPHVTLNIVPAEVTEMNADKFFMGLELTVDKYLTTKRDKDTMKRLIGKAKENYEQSKTKGS